jgi:hypothetical protein
VVTAPGPQLPVRHKRFHHPEVGDLELEFEILHLPDDTGHRILAYAAIPGTPSEAALRLLARSPARSGAGTRTG